MQYSKHKDAAPMDTVSRIRSIIGEIGLETEVTWVESGIKDAYSNHVSILHTSFGTNGKGTSKEYALASGYAELIERMQNGILKAAVRYSKVADKAGFLYSPDEVICSAEEILLQNDAYTRFFFDFFHLNSAKEKKAFLMGLPKMERLPQESFRCLPFADPFSGRVVFVPVDLLFPICGSNGMAAGNTPEEALVQALSEILERYVNKAILSGVVPPEIPRAVWKKTGIAPIIEEIEQDGRYRVSIRDCSLGKGLPVTAVVISDLKLGKFGIHFGCHPSFEVSVERSLTEALQGKKIEYSASMNEIGDSKLCNSVDNGPNLMKLGYGAYPMGLFSDMPSYDFKQNREWVGLSNSEMMKKLFAIIHREGFEILVRDASHLGFPAYHVLVPGMSELFFSNGQRLKELRTSERVIASIKHFPSLSPEEENRLLLLLRYKEFSIMENSFGWIANLPLKGKQLTTERIRAFLHFKRGEYFEAFQWFKNAAETTENEKDKSLLLCSAEFAWLMYICGDAEKVARTIKAYFHPETVAAAHELLHEPSQVMKKAFNSFPCPDCENCPYSGIDCEYPNNNAALMKIQAAMAKSKVDQQNTLKYLSALSVF